MKNNLSAFKTIKYFSSAYDLIAEADPAMFPCFNQDLEDFIRGFDAFEAISYFLVDGEYVLTADSITGDIAGNELHTVLDFLWEIIELYHDQNG